MNKLADIVSKRHKLHQIAELSGNEKNTAAFIVKCLQNTGPSHIYSQLGGYGIAALYDTGRRGKTVMFRAELDALPIPEGFQPQDYQFDYRSLTSNVSHKCGHDGHMAILLALAQWMQENLAQLKGKYILLFQPAEENAAGAKALLADVKFTGLKPDYIFALHNLPGFTVNSLILRQGVFAAASLGLKIHLAGKSSHAGHPENGRNPLFAMQSLIAGLNALPHRLAGFTSNALVTIIHLNLGTEAFGTAPQHGVVMATLRANEDALLQKMTQEAENLAASIADQYFLSLKSERVEEFAATVNSSQAYNILHKAARKSQLSIIQKDKPFAWTEDFSFLSQKYNTAFFGLGAGLKCPQLHNPDYDFPDELITSGLNIFTKIIEEVNL